MSGSSSTTEMDSGNANSESIPLSSSVDLMHPEILSCTTLRSLFKERNMEDQNVDNMDKAALVQLYQKTILPKPQRKYRSNRSGIELTQKQLARKRAASNEEDGVADTKAAKHITGAVGRVNGSQITSLKKSPQDSSKQSSVKLKVTGTSLVENDTAKGSRVIKLINRTLQNDVAKNNCVQNTSSTKISLESTKVNSETSKCEVTSPGKKHARITWP